MRPPPAADADGRSGHGGRGGAAAYRDGAPPSAAGGGSAGHGRGAAADRDGVPPQKPHPAAALLGPCACCRRRPRRQRRRRRRTHSLGAHRLLCAAAYALVGKLQVFVVAEAVAARVQRRRGGLVAAPVGGALAVVLEDEPLQLPPDALDLVRVEQRRRRLLRRGLRRRRCPGWWCG